MAADDLLGKLGEAFVLLRADGSKLPEDLAKQKASLEKQVDAIGQKIKGVGSWMTGAVTAPILGIGAAAISSFKKVDDGLDLIRTKTGQTGTALSGLEADFASVFSNVPDDAEAVAGALGDVYNRTGLTGQGLQDLTEQLLNFSRVTKTDVSANVASATRMFGDWSIATKDQGASLDFVFKTAQATGSSVGALMDKVVQFGAPLRQFNFSFEESVALLGKWEKEGVNSELVLGSLRVAMAKFADANIPLREGLEKTKAAILELGPGAKATGLAMQVFGSRAGPDMAAAILEGRFAVDDLVKTIKGSKETINSAAADTAGFGEKWDALTHKVELALAPLGGKLLDVGMRVLPLLEKLAYAVGVAVDGFGKLPEPVQNAGFILGGLAAASGPILMAVGSFTNLKNVISLLRLTELPGLASSITATARVLAGSGALLGLLGIATLSVGTGVLIAKNDLDKFREAQLQRNEVAKYEVKLNRLVTESWDEYIARVREADAAWKAAKAPAKQLTDITVDLSGALKVGAGATTVSTTSTGALAGAQGKAAGGAKAHGSAVDELTGALGKGTSAADEYKKELAALVSEMGGKNLVHQALLTVAALDAIGGVTKLTKEETSSYNEVLEDTLEKMRLLGRTGTAEFAKIHAAWMKTSQAVFNTKIESDPREFVQSLGPGFKLGKAPERPLPKLPIGQELVGAGAVDDFGNASTGLDILKNLGKTLKLSKPPGLMSNLGSSLRGDLLGKEGFAGMIGPTVLQSLTGGGKVGDAVGGLAGNQIGKSLATTFGKTLTGAFGQTLGGALGSFLPGVGAIIGPLIGKGLSAIGNKILGTNKTKTGREDLAKALGFGNLGGLYDDLKSLGSEGERLAHIGGSVIGRNDEEGNRKWMEEVQEFYRNIAGGADATARAAAKELEAKEKMAAASKAIRDEELGAVDKLKAAVERYGFSIEELGPKWAQQQLDERAAGLIEDFTLLTAAGIDVGVVIGHMADEINDFIKTAIKTGSEVPEAMRPMLEAMVEQGKLTDENGEKLKDLSKVKFSKTLTENFDRVISKLDELIRKITGDLGTSLSNIPNPLITVDVEYDYHGGPQAPTGSPSSDSGDTGDAAPPRNVYGYDDYGNPIELREGGFGNWGAGTPALLHGPEAVIPIDRLAEMMAGAGGGFNAEDLVAALEASGFARPNLVIAPKLEGALASEMYSFAEMFVPWLTRVLQDNGSLRGGMASTLAVTP